MHFVVDRFPDGPYTPWYFDAVLVILAMVLAAVVIAVTYHQVRRLASRLQRRADR